MSIRHMSAVLDRWPFSGAEKVVLILLADHANSDTGVCWPGNERLAARSGVTVRQVQRILADLRKDLRDREGVSEEALSGLTHPYRAISVIHSAGRGHANKYRVNLAVLLSLPPLTDPLSDADFEEGDRVPEPVDNPVDNAHKGVTPMSLNHDTSVTPTVRTIREPSVEGAEPVDCASLSGGV